MAEAAIPLLNIAILGSFMVAGIRELGQVKNSIAQEIEQDQ